ncbi:cytochrome oxidase complex assembly protein 1-domain-containing protein [Lipomyces chichibuensis]|uniref:cytochrome oxidase complex assembly protein 1-domain-containing protein n=1 Tax=Lipomyces chichibuensis TaxID=1546026 RepID=UPI003343F87C
MWMIYRMPLLRRQFPLRIQFPVHNCLRQRSIEIAATRQRQFHISTHRNNDTVSPLATESPEKPKFKVTVDRDLPDVQSRTPRLLMYYSIFFSVMAVISLGFFNYERQQSPIVSSTLYSVRRSPAARDLLGANIRFKEAIPWISGSLDFLHGSVDLSYKVIGSADVPATLHFKSLRRSKGEPFEMVAWELVADDGRRVDLMVEDERPLIKDEAGDSLLGK